MTRTCEFCRAEPGGALVNTVAMLHRCNNCRVDIGTQGQWTGNGWRVFAALVERYGREAVAEEWLRLTAAKERKAPRRRKP